jgi:F420-dependent oxidoreductase-like protein
VRIGLNVAVGPDGPPTHAEILDEVRAAADAGLATAWWPQLPPFAGIAPWDALTSIAAVGAEVPEIGLGSAVVVSYAQHPLALAAQALSTQAIVGNRLTLGVGTSHAAVVEGVFGTAFHEPARYLREYLAILGPALRGEPVDHHGDLVTGVGAVQIPGATPPCLVVAALGPVMLRLAGELADGTVTTWAGPRAVGEHVVPRLSAAAEAAGRPAPRVIVNLPVSVTSDPAGARGYVAERFGMAGDLPSYRRMLDHDGFDGPADAVIVGDEDAVAAEIGRFPDIGATEFLPSVFGPPADRARTLALLSSLATPT